MHINYLFLTTNIISILLALGIPIVLSVILIRKFKVSWLVILTGFVTFAISQVLFYFSIRYLSGILYALIIGLLSALYVELMRLAGFIFLKKKAKSFKSALGFGIGSGAFSGATQSFFNGGLGLSIVIYFFVAVFFNPGAMLAKGVDTATVSSMITQIQQIWAAPWHYGLVLGVESLIIH
jgi:uncharacterized membrane protein YhfC